MKDAEHYLRQCIALCQKWGDTDHQAAAYAMLARLKQGQSNLKEAQEATRVAEEFAHEHSLSFRWSIRLMSDMARLWLSQGNLEMVPQLIRKSGLRVTDEIPYPRVPEYVILLRVLLAQNDYQAALALSERLLRQAEKAGQMGLAIEILILRGLAFQGNKDTDRAVAALEKALSLAQPPEGDMTYAQARAAFPGKFFLANINVSLYELSPAELRRAVQQMARDAAPDGRGLAFAISEDLPANWKESVPVVLNILNTFNTM